MVIWGVVWRWLLGLGFGVLGKVGDMEMFYKVVGFIRNFFWRSLLGLAGEIIIRFGRGVWYIRGLGVGSF